MCEWREVGGGAGVGGWEVLVTNQTSLQQGPPAQDTPHRKHEPALPSIRPSQTHALLRLSLGPHSAPTRAWRSTPTTPAQPFPSLLLCSYTFGTPYATIHDDLQRKVRALEAS